MVWEEKGPEKKRTTINHGEREQDSAPCAAAPGLVDDVDEPAPFRAAHGRGRPVVALPGLHENRSRPGRRATFPMPVRSRSRASGPTVHDIGTCDVLRASSRALVLAPCSCAATAVAEQHTQHSTIPATPAADAATQWAADASTMPLMSTGTAGTQLS